MAYHILAFDPDATSIEQFEPWWGTEQEWLEDHSYDDPAVSTPALRAFYRDLIVNFPPMNGPDAPSDLEIEKNPALEEGMTDYCIGRHLVYLGAAWGISGAIEDECVRLAGIHNIALAFVSWTPLRIQRFEAGQSSGAEVVPRRISAPRRRRWQRKKVT